MDKLNGRKRDFHKAIKRVMGPFFAEKSKRTRRLSKIGRIYAPVAVKLLSQMKRKSNIIIFLLQQDKWSIEFSMSHESKQKTISKAKTMTQKMVTEVRRRRKC